ncbi:hypothetical protein H5410_006196 [Solanum commersonii]|uniref:Uncharacterized protein n=1 Tax=Solanum commersonii TaxID=4109 RepID=A0A9J6A9Q3_SOLCO|nr:hypothetical protein H5410_006196 [Solanum commersonii]
MDELESFPAKISVRARMNLFQNFRNVLLQEKIYNDFKDFCKSYPWGKDCFDLTLKYLKNTINLKKQSEVYRERGNASYALYGFPWEFLAFPHLGNYAKKSLDSPLPIPRLLRWHTTKSDNIIEGDPFKYKGRSTKVMHPYIIPTVYETKQNYVTTVKSYTDEVKDIIIDDLKASLKGVTVLTSAEGNVEDGIQMITILINLVRILYQVLLKMKVWDERIASLE